MDRIRILLADDHTLFRETLAFYLRSQPGFEIVGEAATADEVLQQALASCPDIILLDITMPGQSGLAVLPHLRSHCPDSPVIIVTEHEEPSYLRAAMATGASAYVVKTSPAAIVLQAIHAVRRNETFVDPSLPANAMERAESTRSPSAAPIARLSERERQVLKLLAQGMRYQAVAEKIGVSVKTVETYRSRLKAKLGFKTREDMVRLALEMGILSAAESTTAD